MEDYRFLDEIHDIITKHDEENEKNGFDISFLQIIGKETKEVIICDLIAFLLNPKANHRQGVTFLKLFLEIINETLKKNGKDEIPLNEVFDVYREFKIDKSETKSKQRIDIVLKSNNHFLPIEVKIDAEDQDKQCSDYFEFSNKNYDAKQIFYLTIDRQEPTNKDNLVIGENLILLSFRKEILNWLTECENECEKDRDISYVVKYLIKDLKKQIRKFCGLMEDEKMEKEILDVLCENSKRIDVANYICNLEKRVDTAKLWETFCESIRIDSPFEFEIYFEGSNFIVCNDNMNADIIFQELFTCIDITKFDNNSIEFRYEDIRTRLLKKGFRCTEKKMTDLV